MATPVVTAPEQQIPSPAPAAQPSTLAQLLTPVQPARPVSDGHQGPPLGSTSNLHQDTGSDTSSTGTGGGGSSRDASKDGPVGALVRALASRLGRTGTTRSIKRTHDVKENRTSGNSTATTNANKHDRTNKHDRSAHHRDHRDAKLADLNNKTQQHQAKDSRDAKTANVRDAKTDRSAKTADTRDAKSADTRDAKRADSRDAKTAGSTSAKKDSSAKTTDTRDTKTANSKGDKFAKTDTAGDTKKPDATKSAPGKDATAPGKETGAAQGPADKTDGPAPKTDKPGREAKAGVDHKKADTAVKTTPDATTTTPAPTTKEPLRTRSSREAGYRDGQRAAGVVGHVQAWRDGTRDGWDVRQAEDQDERKRMDTAKARNAVRPQAPTEPQMTPATGSTADLRKQQAAQAAARAAAPVPAQVTAVGENAIQFTADGAQHSMSRGEVRTLKAFERRIADKRTALGRAAEISRGTRATATDQAVRAQNLAETAKDVEGGDGLLRALTRLAEQAAQLRARAEEIEKRAGKGAEALAALAANAETRHGGIYKAVADSPLTAPAERDFYQDKQGN